MRIRTGFTLIEVVIAILVFAIGGLGLAASAAAVAKQISANNLRSDAATIARSRAETAQSATCGSMADGEARSSGIHSVWSVGGINVATLDQQLERSDAFGSHRDRFLSAVPCD